MTPPHQKTVLITGANGYLGSAIAHAFVRSGWSTYGLVRTPSPRSLLAAHEITSILGSASDKAFVERLATQTRIAPFDVIVSCTEQILDYVPHFNDTVELLRALAGNGLERGGKRPLVLFTSGCKDYGETGLHGETGLVPHTEESALMPPAFAVERASHAIRIFEHAELFDAVVLRPTTIYGLSSGFYGAVFDVAAKATEKGVLEVSADPKSIMHGTHVDDCAEAYVAVAEAEREVVRGQCYNISSHRYETLNEVAQAIVEDYGIKDGVKYLPAPEMTGIDVVQMLFGFSQWVSSEKLRKDVGWKDRKMLFSEGIRVYRKAFEAAVNLQDPGVEKVRAFVRMAEGGGGET